MIGIAYIVIKRYRIRILSSLEPGDILMVTSRKAAPYSMRWVWENTLTVIYPPLNGDFYVYDNELRNILAHCEELWNET